MSARRRFIGRPSARLSRRTLLAAGLVAAAALGVISLSGPAVPVGGPFSLVDGAGRRWTDADFRGRYLLVYFGYTFCPDVCPTALGELSAALGRLPPGVVNELRVIFISVDPERDTGLSAAVALSSEGLDTPFLQPGEPPEWVEHVQAWADRTVGITADGGFVAADRAIEDYLEEHDLAGLALFSGQLEQER